ncbi:sugar transferase [Dyadobacter sp. NIV53]|uniref:sugar transferase n=1 Tax=Dyadobacter sp. NIV53 TaxID=2861765 RepID=UPI001C889383|nr:sugar transferase [Dyadobacter sp. NIV53]
MNNELAPILLFVFNRPAHTRQTLEALAENTLASESILYIFADGAKDEGNKEDLLNIKEVREIIKKTQWCKEVHIIESETNKGLANSIIDGVTEKVNQHGKVIVLEDDLITSKGFLEYMNQALNKFISNEKVMHVSGYQFPIDSTQTGSSYFIPLISSWGWGTWKRAWNQFDPLSTGYQRLKTDKELIRKFDFNNSYPYSTMLLNQMEGNNNVNSWAIRWWWAVFNHNGVSLFPDSSLVKNIGFDKSATHTKGSNPYEINVFDKDYFITSYPTRISINEPAIIQLQKLYRKTNPAYQGLFDKLWRKVINKIQFVIS